MVKIRTTIKDISPRKERGEFLLPRATTANDVGYIRVGKIEYYLEIDGIGFLSVDGKISTLISRYDFTW